MPENPRPSDTIPGSGEQSVHGICANPFYDAPPLQKQKAADVAMHDKLYRSYPHMTQSGAEYEKNVVKSAHRALQVFEFFAKYRLPANATTIALNLDFPQSSTSMLLRSLVSLGYLRHDRVARLYSPTLRLSLIGEWQTERVGVASEILRMMERLNAETGECVMLAEQYRYFVRYIYALQSHNADNLYHVPPGTLRPICTSAFGQILLTQKPDKETRMLIHRACSYEDSTDYEVNLDSVMEAIHLARERGFACTSRTVNELRFYQIAALLPPRSGDLPMAVGITCYGDRLPRREKELIELLLKRISQLKTQEVTAPVCL